MRVVAGGAGEFDGFRLYRLLQTAGQSLAGSLAGGKSGLHGDMAVDNVHPAQAEGKCHRKQTAPRCAELVSVSGVRVKGWGKSPPGLRRRGPHGKPRQEQDRIGGVYGPSSARAPGVSHQACSNARRRGMTAEPARGNRTRLTGRLDSYLGDAAERIDFAVR